MELKSRQEERVIDGPLIGRLIMGQLGVLIDRMKGLGERDLKSKIYLIMTFWNLSTRRPDVLLIDGPYHKIENFLNRYKKEFENRG